MEWKLWLDSFAAGFGGEMGFCFKILLSNPFSICGIVNQNSLSRVGGKTMGFSCGCGMICPACWTQRADKTTWLSCVASYHSELLRNPLSTFYDTIYDRMRNRGERRLRGSAVGWIVMESLPYCPVLWLHVSSPHNMKHMAIGLVIQGLFPHYYS